MATRDEFPSDDAFEAYQEAEHLIVERRAARDKAAFLNFNFHDLDHLPRETADLVALREFAQIKHNRERSHKDLHDIRAAAGLPSIEDWAEAELPLLEAAAGPTIPAQKLGLGYRVSADGPIEMAPTDRPEPGDG